MKEGKKEGQGEFNIQEEREEKKGPHRGPKFSWLHNSLLDFRSVAARALAGAD